MPLRYWQRGPDAFDNPDAFDPERKHINRHSAFGLGSHICLGQFIARAQIQEGFYLLAQRIKSPRLAGPVGYRPFMGAGGLKGLPIAFDCSERDMPYARIYSGEARCYVCNAARSSTNDKIFPG